MSRKLALLTTAALTIGGLAAAPYAPAGAAAPTNGPLLYLSDLKAPDGSVVADTPYLFGGPSQFSPDGTRIATIRSTCTDDSCTEVDSAVVVFDDDGSQTETAHFVNDFPVGLVWSPDQTEVAVLSGFVDASILRVPLDGSAASTVIASDASFRVEGEGLSWHPDGGSIAFIGTELDVDGSSLARDTDQVYVVPATGGTASRFNTHQTQSDCEFPECQSYEYRLPSWSPDGTRVAAYVVDEHEDFQTEVLTISQYIGTVSQGQKAPTEVHRLRTDVNPSQYPILGSNSIEWSTDGGRMLYAYGIGDGSESVAEILTLGSGAVTPVADEFYRDWQPCPTGTCADWSTPAEPVDSTLTLAVAKKRGDLKVSGALAPSRPGQSVALAVQKQARKGAPWKTVSSKSATLTATSRFTKTFAIPSAYACRVKASYAGDGLTRPSSAKKAFAC